MPATMVNALAAPVGNESHERAKLLLHTVWFMGVRSQPPAAQRGAKRQRLFRFAPKQFLACKSCKSDIAACA